jgi:hypothetical protein
LKGSQKEGEGDSLDADALSEGQGRVTAAGRGVPRPRNVTGGGLDFRVPFYAPACGGGRGAAYGRRIFLG